MFQDAGRAHPFKVLPTISSSERHSQEDDPNNSETMPDRLYLLTVVSEILLYIIP